MHASSQCLLERCILCSTGQIVASRFGVLLHSVVLLLPCVITDDFSRMIPFLVSLNRRCFCHVVYSAPGIRVCMYCEYLLLQHLSYLLSATTGNNMSAREWATEHFAKPLGIPDLYRWFAQCCGGSGRATLK